MATPTYEQIQSFNDVTQQLKQCAVDEFMQLVNSDMSIDEVIEIASQIADSYGILASELGAQWYDLCTRLANVDAEPAELQPLDADSLRDRARGAVDAAPDGANAGAVLNSFLGDIVQESIKTTGNANLWRDYERGLIAGKWARVPVGDTCAWCLMLASQGAWYLTKETALGNNGGHYHKGCNCVAVYHADPIDIPNYSKLTEYKDMYYTSDNIRRANDKGIDKYPEDLKERIQSAKEQHEKRAKEAEENDEEIKPWTVYNEDLIIMRYKYGVS